MNGASGTPNYLRMARAQGKLAGRIDSELEALFARDLKASKFPAWVRNYPFLAGSKKEIDFAWPEWKFGVEIEGAVHMLKERFHGDFRKHVEALLAGWTIVRLDRPLVTSGEGVRFAEELLFRARWAIEGEPSQVASSARPLGCLSDDSDLGVGPG